MPIDLMFELPNNQAYNHGVQNVLDYVQLVTHSDPVHTYWRYISILLISILGQEIKIYAFINIHTSYFSNTQRWKLKAEISLTREDTFTNVGD